MDNKNIFARNLEYQMALAGKSRRDLSEALGVSYYTITDWVKGKKYPRMDKVEMLARYFGIQKSDLIEDKKRKPTAADDGLSDEMKQLIERIKMLPADKVRMLLQVAESIK
jgi:transcriptional regulator with XRE-family HTH domain